MERYPFISTNGPTPFRQNKLAFFLICQPTLSIDGGHASRGRSGDGLPIGVVLDVTTGEHAIHVGGRTVRTGHQVARLVHVQNPAEQVGIGAVANGNEHTGHR